MSTLTDRLTAILGNVPEAVEEYRKQDPRRVGGAASWGDWYVKRSVADAALAALVDALEEEHAENLSTIEKAGEIAAGLMIRAEQAEAALAERERWLDEAGKTLHKFSVQYWEMRGLNHEQACDQAKSSDSHLADLRARAAEEGE